MIHFLRRVLRKIIYYMPGLLYVFPVKVVFGGYVNDPKLLRSIVSEIINILKRLDKNCTDEDEFNFIVSIHDKINELIDVTGVGLVSNIGVFKKRIYSLGKYRVGSFKLTLQCFELPEDESHLPHCHKGLISTAMVLKGEVGFIESETRFEQNKTVELNQITRKYVKAEDENGVLATNSYKNFHTFKAVKDSIILNVNIRGVGECKKYSDRQYLNTSYEELENIYINGAVSRPNIFELVDKEVLKIRSVNL